MNICEIQQILDLHKCCYELIAQDKPILSAAYAKQYYPIEKAAPMLVLQSEKGLLGCIVSFQHGKLNFDELKRQFGFIQLKLADRKVIKEETGYDIGTIPLAGLGLACIFDKKLLKHDFVFGGTGNERLTLKIKPADLLRVNVIIGQFE